MGIDGHTFVPKSGYFLLIRVKVCLKSGLFLRFDPILPARFFDKMLALSNKKSTSVLVSGFFDCCIFTILFKFYSKGRFQLKRHFKLP